MRLSFGACAWLCEGCFIFPLYVFEVRASDALYLLPSSSSCSPPSPTPCFTHHTCTRDTPRLETNKHKYPASSRTISPINSTLLHTYYDLPVQNVKPVVVPGSHPRSLRMVMHLHQEPGSRSIQSPSHPNIHTLHSPQPDTTRSDSHLKAHLN